MTDIRGKLCGIDAPVGDLRIGITKIAGVASCCGRIKHAAFVIEGRQWSLDIFVYSRRLSVGAILVTLRRNKGLGVNGLPDCDQTVDVCVV